MSDEPISMVEWRKHFGHDVIIWKILLDEIDVFDENDSDWDKWSDLESKSWTNIFGEQSISQNFGIIPLWRPQCGLRIRSLGPNFTSKSGLRRTSPSSLQGPLLLSFPPLTLSFVKASLFSSRPSFLVSKRVCKRLGIISEREKGF